MKNTLAILFLLISFNSFCQFQEDEDIELYKSLGLQTEVVYEYLPKFGEPDLSTKFLSEKSEFDNKGRITKYENYYESEYLKEYEEVKTFSYDDDHLVKIVTYNIGGEIKSIIKYKYENGNNIERLFYSDDGTLTSKTTYIFDDKGNCIEYSSFNADGIYESKHTSEYNADNELTKSTYFDKKNKFESYYTYERTNVTEKYKKYNSKNEIEVRSIKKLNEKGLVVEQLYFNASEIPSKTIYEYDENDLVIKKTKFAKNGEPEKYAIIERY